MCPGRSSVYDSSVFPSSLSETFHSIFKIYFSLEKLDFNVMLVF